MDVATPLKALPEPLAPGHYLGWVCRNCQTPIKVFPPERATEVAPSPFVALWCAICEKTVNFPWNQREAIEVLPPGK